MKNISVAIILTALFWGVASCEKIKQRTLFGKIVEADTKNPIANSTYVLAVTSFAQGINGTEKIREYSFATDSKGEFRFMFEASSDETLSIGYPGGSIYWSKAIGRKDLEINAGTIEDNKP